MCAQCEGKEPYQPSEWFQHIWFLYLLQKGGYPFEKNDLTLDEWLSIAELKGLMEKNTYG